MKTKFFLVLSLVLTLALAACNPKPTTEEGKKKSETPGATKPTTKQITVGYSQVGAESAWRTANTESIKSEAKKRGVNFKFVDAQQKQENQIKALRSFITQKVDVILLSPVVATGWEPVLRECKAAKIPVICSDRSVDVSDQSLYATFIGADFYEEGRRAGEWLAKKMNGKAMIAELEGSPGADAAIARKRGFADALAKYPEMKILISQTGEFTRAKGKEVMEAFLKAPEGKQINALFAQNDDMGLGAIQAIEAAGLKPGQDITIVSIDGVKGIFEAMVAGKANCTIECQPLIGPLVFNAVEEIVAGKPVQKRIKTHGDLFEPEAAKKAIATRKY